MDDKSNKVSLLYDGDMDKVDHSSPHRVTAIPIVLETSPLRRDMAQW